MTIANKITLLRILLIPVFMAAYEFLGEGSFAFVPTLIFAVAAFTDMLDGYLARSRNEVTTFGKFMDPIADKVLVMAAMLLLVRDHRLSAVAAVIFLAREFIVSGFRLVAAAARVVIAASPLAKVKTVSQLVAMILLLLNNYPFSLIGLPLADISVYVALVFTIWSGIEYIVRNRGVLSLQREIGNGEEAPKK